MNEIEFPAPFQLVRQIASGASSTVYEAKNLESQETVALKVFHSKVTSDPQFFERLEREASALRQIRHSNIVRLIRPWTLEGKFFLELELVHGTTLKQWLENEPREWLEPRIWMLASIARALGAVHQEQILHRDLKPENILVATDGTVKLTDFGLAKSQLMKTSLTHTGSLIGSLCYMAPETIEGKKATFASDIYSFAVIAYEILCFRHPFTDTEGQLLLPNLLASRFVSSLKANPMIPYEVGSLIDRCLSLKEADRPSSIWTVEADLLNYLHGSKLLPEAKRWVEAGQSERSLSSALQAKHQQLKTDIESLKISGSTDRKKLFSRLNECSGLFPDDPAVAQTISTLTDTETKSNRRGLILFLLPFVFVGSIGIYFAITNIPKSATASAPAIPSVPVAAPVAAEPPVKAITKPVRAVAKKGVLVILADPGVVAYLNGIRVLRSQFAGQQLMPGKYSLLLEREGFMPIERPISVVAGKTVTINTIPGGK